MKPEDLTAQILRTGNLVFDSCEEFEDAIPLLHELGYLDAKFYHYKAYSSVSVSILPEKDIKIGFPGNQENMVHVLHFPSFYSFIISGELAQTWTDKKVFTIQ